MRLRLLFTLGTVGWALLGSGLAIGGVNAAPTQQGTTTPTSPTAAAPSGAQGQTPEGRGRGARGGGGLPPLNPIDENAPLPPLVTPGRTFGEPPNDAVVLFDGRDLSQWRLRDGSPAKCKPRRCS